MTLARDGLLRRALSRTSSRFHTPVGGLSVIALWALVVIGWRRSRATAPLCNGSHVLGALLILLATGSYLITLVYVPLAGGCLWLLRAERGQPWSWWRIPIVPVAIAVPILSLVGSLDPFPAYSNDLALRGWKPAVVSGAARHAEDGPDRPAVRTGS